MHNSNKLFHTLLLMVAIFCVFLACGGSGDYFGQTTYSAAEPSDEITSISSANSVFQNSLNSGQTYDNALKETVEYLKTQNNIVEAVINEPKSAIELTFTNGEVVIYKTITKTSSLWSTQADSQAPYKSQRRSSSVSILSNAITRVSPLNKTAVLFCPFQKDLNEDLDAIRSEIRSAGYEITEEYVDAQATMINLVKILDKNFGVYYISTHGSCCNLGVIATAEQYYSFSEALPMLDEMKAYAAAPNNVVAFGYIDGYDCLFPALSSSYILESNNFSSSLFYLNACESMHDFSMWSERLLLKGAGAVVGWKKVVSISLVKKANTPFFDQVAIQDNSVESALNYLYNLPELQPAYYWRDYYMATIEDLVSEDNDLLYVLNPSDGNTGINILGLAITSTRLTDGTIGLEYSNLLSCNGGVPPYTWNLESGTLQNGLVFHSDGTVSGVPTETGVKSISVSVTDGNGDKDTKAFSLSVYDILTVGTDSVPDGICNLSYNYTFVTNGGAAPFSWSLTSGTLHNGLSFSSNGVITGVPTETGTKSFSVTISDSIGNSSSKDFTLTVGSVLVASELLDNGFKNEIYNFNLQANGGVAPYEWSLESGDLPAGLTLNPDGSITGTPSTVGVANFTVRVTDSVMAFNTKEFSLQVGLVSINEWNKVTSNIWPPQARASGASVVINGKMYIFGGRISGSIDLNDLYVFDPVSSIWTELSPGGSVPSGRKSHTAVTIDNKMYVFGGFGSFEYKNDLWAYDPVANTWTELNPAGTLPVARYGHKAVVINNKMYVFGGYDSVGFKNDLWEYDPALNTWIELSPGGVAPVARRDHSATVLNGKMYIFGGWYKRNDMHAYDPIANTWTEILPGGTAPSGRNYHTAVTIDNKMYVFGGYDGANTNNLFVYDPGSNTWSELFPTGVLPAARSYHTAVSIGTKMYVFSGSESLDDFWQYDTALNKWVDITQSNRVPISRDRHSVVVIDNSMYVFGGALPAGGEWLNDLWKYDFALNVWTKLAPGGAVPSARVDHSAVVFNGKMYVFAGGAYNDLRVYDPVTNNWTLLTPVGGPPAIRFGHTAVLINGKMYVFGGNQPSLSVNLNDLWVYDFELNTWTELFPAGTLPVARELHASVAMNGKMYVFGGYGNFSLNDLWEYAPESNAWVEIVPTGVLPERRNAHTAFCVVNGKIIIYGGSRQITGLGNDLWEYDIAANLWLELNPGGILPPVCRGHSTVVYADKAYSFQINELWFYSP